MRVALLDESQLRTLKVVTDQTLQAVGKVLGDFRWRGQDFILFLVQPAQVVVESHAGDLHHGGLFLHDDFERNL